jgi:hypothetical protein
MCATTAGGPFKPQEAYLGGFSITVMSPLRSSTALWVQRIKDDRSTTWRITIHAVPGTGSEPLIGYSAQAVIDTQTSESPA